MSEETADYYARRVSELASELERASDMHDRAIAAEQERRTLVNQAMRHHISNVSSELRRYEVELDQINAVCDSRTETPNLKGSP